jgi:nucleoside-diphosphate-sugar epimerase
MKTALIIGIGGNFGHQMAQALSDNGWQIKALMRDAKKAPKWLNATQIKLGSARDKSTVLQAAQGVDLIVYAANPQYHRWHEEALQMLEPTVQIAEELGLCILFPGNVYNFTPTEQRISEQQAMRAPSDKGKIRIAMEARLQKASLSGAKVTIVRAGDFLGEQMQMSWLDHMLKGKNGQYKLAMPHDERHVHYWTYLPDLCANAAMLMSKSSADFEVWHDPGLALTTHDWQEAFIANGYSVKTSALPWWVFRFIAPFNPMLREVLKMRYLWQQPVVMDGSKMQGALGARLRKTEFKAIVASMVKRSHHTGTQLKQA